MGVRTPETVREPRPRLPGPGRGATFAVATLAAALLLANGRPGGEPELSGLAGAMLQLALWAAGLLLELDPLGRAVVGKVLAALCAGGAAGALFAAAARCHALADARASALVLALGTTLAAASQSWVAEVPASTAVAVALALLSRADAEDSPTHAARGMVALALAVLLWPATWGLALVLGTAAIARWRRAVLPLLLWGVPSALLAVVGVLAGSGPQQTSGPGVSGLALIASPARGVLFFAPVVLVAGAGIAKALRARAGRDADLDALPLAAAAAGAAHVIWTAVAGCPGGVPFWGPRGLAPAWPPLLLLLPEGLALLRTAGYAIVAVSVTVQTIGAFAYDGRWDRLYGADAGNTWNLARSPIVFQVRERVMRPALVAPKARRLVVHEYPMVVAGPSGSHVSFAGDSPIVDGVDPILEDVLLEGGARVVDGRLRLRGPEDALFFRVRRASRARRLELRIAGRGPGLLGIGEKTFWTALRWHTHRVGGTFRLRVPWSYAESAGGDLRLAARSGVIEILSVDLVPPGQPENVIRLGGERDKVGGH